MPKRGENIYHRSDGRYEGRYMVSRDENGKAKYKSVYGDSKDEVRVKIAEAKAALDKERLEGITTFEEAYNAWIDDRRSQVTAATADRYEYLLERFILPAFGQLDVEQISPAQIGVHVSSLANAEERGDGAVSVSVAEILLEFTTSIIAYAKGGDTAAEVFRSARKKKAEQVHCMALSAGEIRRLISCARYNKSAEMLGVLLSLYTGIGTGELCALSWDDVDVKRREIFIHNTIYRIRDKSESDNRTKLTVMEVRKSAVRTVTYPEELSSYVKEFYKKGTVFLTGEKRYIEQKTLWNHLDKVFASYGLEGLKIQRITKTYKEGKADIRFLQDPFFRPEDGAHRSGINEKWLLKEMENDLSPLRGILGLSGEDMGQVLGISEEEYLALEAGEQSLDWHRFLSLLFFFRYNAKTEGVVDALGLFPGTLRDKIAIRK